MKILRDITEVMTKNKEEEREGGEGRKKGGFRVLEYGYIEVEDDT